MQWRNSKKYQLKSWSSSSIPRHFKMSFIVLSRSCIVCLNIWVTLVIIIIVIIIIITIIIIRYLDISFTKIDNIRIIVEKCSLLKSFNVAGLSLAKDINNSYDCIESLLHLVIIINNNNNYYYYYYRNFLTWGLPMCQTLSS